VIQRARLLTILGMLWFFFGLLLTNSALRAAVNADRKAVYLVFVFGVIGTLSIFAAWGLALYHWKTRFQGSSKARHRWGIALVFGAFVAGWVYWLTRGRELPTTTSPGLSHS
jgi:hypothetical protein